MLARKFYDSLRAPREFIANYLTSCPERIEGPSTRMYTRVKGSFVLLAAHAGKISAYPSLILSRINSFYRGLIIIDNGPRIHSRRVQPR